MIDEHRRLIDEELAHLHTLAALTTVATVSFVDTVDTADMVDTAAGGPGVAADTHLDGAVAEAIEAISLAMAIRGYEDLKMRRVDEYRSAVEARRAHRSSFDR